ncbi:hypothetical protein QR680_014467 [Steinernema hermaphroditum]|uniref:Nuclear receptor domain-containing protein n=1 Tax=Steinernema hermaphroditum TaxID=289476 RepID=A0AA39I8Z5_9BILA|nr:hypothetical protein QR680_014467 [Steinernema hermaphroditum]
MSEIPSVCFVCGNMATCCHYGAPSCSSCKTFFRRNTLMGRSMKCAQDGKCRIETGMRCCRACRYQKCLKVGMSPHRVIDKQNRKECYQPLISFLCSRDGALSAKLNDLLYIEQKIKVLRESDYFPYSLSRSIEAFLAQPSPLNQADNYQIITNWLQPIQWKNFSSEVPQLPYKLWGYVEIVLAIEFYKTFDIFNSLPHSDKLCLLKATLRQIRLFHSSYDSYLRGHKEVVVEPDGYVPFAHHYRYSTQQFRFECADAYDKFHKATCVSACEDAKMTIEKAVLLKAIIAMNHDAPNLSEEARELILEERLKYVNILMRTVRLESPSDMWLSDFLRLYSMVNRNIFATNCLANLFFSEVVPLTCTSTGVKLERIWVELLIQ